ncbi:MAG TPA: M1 family aminopeptidase [Thermoanaerobaculia bacterium]|nr:M1 family aminopeptidase [Thermoanaerobaculia bacterium]
MNFHSIASAASRGLAAGALLAAASAAGATDRPRGDLDVERYHFALHLRDDTDRIEGEATVILRWREDGHRELRLDLVAPPGSGDGERGMSVGEVADLGERSSDTTLPLRFHHAGDDLVAELEAPSRAGELGRYRIRYGGVPADGLIIGANRHGDRTFFGDNWPDRARHWLPTVDHPSDKAYVSFEVTAPAHYQVVSNGVRREVIDLPGGARRTRYETTAPLASKLMVVGVARFAVELVAAPGGVPVETWVFPQDRDSGFAELAVAKRVLEVLQAQLGPFPYAKLANVQSKTRYGGMENAGAIFYHEGVVSGGDRVEALVAHEVAHQWFGNAVTESDWPHLWLSEGFATYLAHRYFELTRGRDAMVERLREDRALVLSYGRDHPVPVVREDYERPGDLLDALAYRKGSFVLHMLRREIGERAFWDAVELVVRRFAHGNADTGEVRAVFEEVAEVDLRPFFDQWLRRPGHPRLEARWSFEPAAASTADPSAAGGVVRVDLEQVQAEPAFRFPLEVALRRAGKELARGRLELSGRSASLAVPVAARPDELVLDPDAWLLFELADVDRIENADGRSGSAQGPSSPPEPARFHHVHLNVTDVAATVDFYRRAFGAQPIRYAERADALYVERSFLLLEPVSTPPRSESRTGLWHIGWGATDVAATQHWLLSRGVREHTPIYRIPNTETWVTYWYGPDREMIEVNTMGHHRFAHVHLLARDVNDTTGWYRDHLGLVPRREHVPKPQPGDSARAWSNGFRADNVSFVVYGTPETEPLPEWWREPPLRELLPTRGHVLDHVAFSYRDIEPVLGRMRAAGVEIAAEIAEHPRYGFRSFFVVGPDGVLVEIVEARPIPDGAWD